jgi:hypothetical protein
LPSAHFARKHSDTLPPPSFFTLRWREIAADSFVDVTFVLK